MKPHALLLSLALLPLLHVQAEDRLVLSQVQGEVTVESSGRAVAAKPGDVLPAGASVRTGDDARAEATGPQGVIRYGSKSYVQVTDPDEIRVEDEGLFVIASKPKRLFRSSMTARTPEHTVTVTGTAQGYYLRDAYLMVTCVEGYVDLRDNGFLGDTIRLKKGQTILITPTEPRLPDPVDINLQRLYDSSALLEGPLGPLPTYDLIMRAIQDQMQNPDYAQTPLVIPDGGTHVDVILDTPKARDAREERVIELPSERLTIGLREITPGVPPATVRVLITQAGETRDYGFLSLTEDLLNLSDLLAPGKARLSFETSDTAAAFELLIDLTADAGAPVSELFNFTLGPNQSASVDVIAPAALDPASDFSLASANIVRATLANVAAPTVDISSGNEIHLNQSVFQSDEGVRLSGNSGIQVTNSSQILALAQNVEMLTAGGPILVSQSRVEAPVGSIVIDGTSSLTVENSASLLAESIRARVFGNGGTLTVSNSVMNAADLLNLYAEGASTLLFVGNVDLTGRVVNLAGNVVRVEPAGQVSITGQGRVFANLHEYNRDAFGTITATQPGVAIEQLPFPSRPSFDR